MAEQIIWFLDKSLSSKTSNLLGAEESPWPPNVTFGTTVYSSGIELNLCAPQNITAKEAKNETNPITRYTFGLPILGLLFSSLSV